MTITNEEESDMNYPNPTHPSPGDIIGPGATVLAYTHRGDSTSSTYAYGRVLALWRGEFVVWKEVAYRPDEGAPTGWGWLASSGEYFKTDLVGAVEYWASL